jgi:archaellum component FlaC
MVDNVENLVLELLRAIRSDIADLNDRMTGVEIQVSALGQQLAGLTMAVYSGKNDLEVVKRRIERLEQWRELHDVA